MSGIAAAPLERPRVQQVTGTQARVGLVVADLEARVRRSRAHAVLGGDAAALGEQRVDLAAVAAAEALVRGHRRTRGVAHAAGSRCASLARPSTRRPRPRGTRRTEAWATPRHPPRSRSARRAATPAGCRSCAAACGSAWRARPSARRRAARSRRRTDWPRRSRSTMPAGRLCRPSQRTDWLGQRAEHEEARAVGSAPQVVDERRQRARGAPRPRGRPGPRRASEGRRACAQTRSGTPRVRSTLPSSGQMALVVPPVGQRQDTWHRSGAVARWAK